MIKRRWLTCILAIAAALCMGICAIGCKPQDDPNKNKTPKLTLSAATLELGLFESKTLTATLENINGTIVWSSTDPSVITVVEGKVTAKKIGNATVKVTAGILSEECAVTVVRGTLTPEFDTLEETLTLVKGSAYPLDASLVLGGESFDLAEVSFELVGTDGVIEISEEGVITAKKYGTQSVTVKAVYNDITLAEQTIAVTVIESGAIETGLASNELSLTATAIADGAVNKFDTSAFKTMVNGADVKKEITLTSSDASIVEISGKEIIAKKAGEATVTAKFTADSETVYDVAVKVNVSKETVTVKTDFFEQSEKDARTTETGKTALDFSEKDVYLDVSEITAVYSGETSLEFAKEGNVLTLTNAAAGENEYKLVSDRVDVIINAFIYQTAISSAEEYKAWFGEIGAFCGYSILTADIDLAGATVGTASWWAGTLDGRGHTVANFNTENGLMGQSNENACFKNIQFVNMVVDGYEGGVVGQDFLGTLENVLIFANIKNAKEVQSVVGKNEYQACKMTNVIIFASADNAESKYYGFGQSYSQSSGLTTDNVYLVFGKEITLKKDTATSNNAVLCENVAGLLEVIDKTAFEKAGWTVSDGKIPVMGDYTAAMENAFYSINGKLEANSEVTIESSLFDGEYSLKEPVEGISLSGNKITIGDVGTAKDFIVVVKSKSFENVAVEIPLSTYKYNNVTYGAKYLATKDGKTSLDTSKIPNFSGEFVKVAVDNIPAASTVSDSIVTFDNNAVGNKTISVYTESDVFTFNTVVADVVISTPQDLFDALRPDYALANRRYIVLANDLQMDDTEINAGFCCDFVFDGLGYTIYDAYDYCGLFRNNVNTITVKNINFVNLKSYMSILGGKPVGKVVYENVNLINCKIRDNPYEFFLLYSANYEGNEVIFKNCNIDFAIDANLADKPFALVQDEGFGSITFDNVKVTSNGTIVKIGEDGYGTNFTVSNLTITDKRDLTVITYDGNLIANGSETILDLAKLSNAIDGTSIKTVYIGGAEVSFKVENGILYIGKSVIGMTDIEIFTENAKYTVAVTVNDWKQNVTYSEKHVKRTDGNIVFDLSKLSNFSGNVTGVKFGEASLNFTQSGNSLTVSNVSAWDESSFVIASTAGEYKFTTIVVTDYISDEASWKAFMEDGTAKRYALFTSDIEITTEGISTAFLNEVVIDGDNHKIAGNEPVYNWSGLFANSLTDATIKNIEFNRVKGFWSLFGWKMTDVVFDNITVKTGFIPNGENTEGLLVACVNDNSTFTVKNCDFNFVIDNSFVNTAYPLCTINSGATLNIIDTKITFNGTMVKPGEKYGEADWGSNGTVNVTNSTFKDKDDVDDTKVTYTDGYVKTDGSKITIDFSKIEGATVSEITSAYVGADACSVSESDSGVTISTEAVGEKTIKLITSSSTYVFDIVIAEVVLSDSATFRAWATAGEDVSGGKYAVVSQDITMDSGELNTNWFAGWTLNGLGHSIKNLYDWSGFTESGTGGITMKNIRIEGDSETYSSILGNDWYGTNNFENVVFHVTIKGNYATAILFDGIRDGAVCNFKNSSFNIYFSDTEFAKTALPLHTMKGGSGSITINMENSEINSYGVISEVPAGVNRDSTSIIKDQNGNK